MTGQIQTEQEQAAAWPPGMADPTTARRLLAVPPTVAPQHSRAIIDVGRAEIAAVIRGQLDSDFGPFADDMLGAQNRVQACIRAHGKTPGDLVNELLAKEVA